MVKLERLSAPVELTEDFVKNKTEEFKVTKKPVWNIDWLKIALLEQSYGKCAYCESYLKEESKYIEVEHFEDKANNPDKVLLWENLLPSCKKCNGKKGTHDVILFPIVNPFEDNPKESFKLVDYNFVHKDEKGERTIDKLDLNHVERLVYKRFNIGSSFYELIKLTLKMKFDFFVQSNEDSSLLFSLVEVTEDILQKCQIDKPFSAVCSTILHSHDVYKDVKSKLEKYDSWNDTLEELHCNSLKLELR